MYHRCILFYPSNSFDVEMSTEVWYRRVALFYQCHSKYTFRLRASYGQLYSHRLVLLLLLLSLLLLPLHCFSHIIYMYLYYAFALTHFTLHNAIPAVCMCCACVAAVSLYHSFFLFFSFSLFLCFVFFFIRIPFVAVSPELLFVWL